MPTDSKSTAAYQRSLRNKVKAFLMKRLSVLVPVVICIYLLVGLFAFVLLKGDMNNWYAFMRNDAEVALFAMYCVIGVVGMGLVILLKKGLNLLGVSKRVLVASFLIAIIVGTCVFTYLNFSATQDNYAWMNDGWTYQRMAQSFLVNHEFIIDGNYTHHFGPVYPLYLAVFYVFLPIPIGTKVAVELSFILAILVVFFVTKKMYGATPALVTTGIIATLPNFIFATSRNYSEPFVLMLFTLTMYFILESLKPQKENRIILAGLTAALGCLTKSSFGYFFIVAGLTGFLWRFYYMRWRVFKNKNYLLAIVIFFALLLVWTARNLHHFWDGTFLNLFAAVQPSDYMYRATVYTFTVNFGGFFIETLFFALFLGFFMLAYSWPFAENLKKSFKRIREERLSCLLVAVMLALGIGLVTTSMYFIFETGWMPSFWVSYFPQQQVRYFLYNLVRYCFIAIVPLSWLAYESDRRGK
jgi:hypothetical protein